MNRNRTCFASFTDEACNQIQEVQYDPCTDAECKYLVSMLGYPSSRNVFTMRVNDGGDSFDLCSTGAVTNFPLDAFVGDTFLFKGNIYYCLGKEPDGTFIRECRVYDKIRNQWPTKFSLDNGSAEFTLIRKDVDTVLFLGGRHGNM